MTRQQAVAYALTDSPAPDDQGKPADTTTQASDLLNAREIEILELVADGQTNREIAGELFLSVNTVKWYLKEIYGKLDAANRAEAAARAQALGILTRD